MIRTICLLSPLCLLLAGCGVLFDWPEPDDNSNSSGETGKVELNKFKSADEFQQYFTSQVASDHRYDSRGGGLAVDDAQFDADSANGGDAGGAAPGDEAAAPPTPTAEDGDGTANSEDFSTTTTQEEGVQESDIIKNDGTYIYVMSNSYGAYSAIFDSDDQSGAILRIVQANPGEALQELSSVELDGYGEDLYLLENRVVALTRGSVLYEAPVPVEGEEYLPPPVYYRSRVQVTVIDVTDRAVPTVASTTWFEGSLSSSRMIGDDLHLVLTNFPDFFRPLMDPGVGAEPELVETEVDVILPDFEVRVADSEPITGNTTDWPNFYYPTDPDGYGLTTVISLDVNAPADFHSVGVVAYPGNIYASTEALYLTDADYDFFGDSRQMTDIYKFSFTDDGPVLVGVGAVPGRILNQYSMSEYEGHLRVATTLDPRWLPGGPTTVSTNHVYVLAEEGDELTIVGRAENLAPTEAIYSARFSGPRGYLVTFEQIDPLFTLDLSDPTNPHVVGELKIPGFSTFIIEMDEDHLLTIGQDAVDEGWGAWPRGVQLSIFDISDFANPQRTFTELIGDPDAWSEALYNPKALTYFGVQDLLAVPVEIYDYGFGGWDIDGEVVMPDDPIEPEPDVDSAESGEDVGSNGVGQTDEADETEGDGDEEPGESPETVSDEPPALSDEFRGLYIYRVTPEGGFELLGRLSTVTSDDYYYSSFTRGVFMNDDVFGVTEQGVVGAPVTAIETAPWQISFPVGMPDEFPGDDNMGDVVTSTDAAERG